MGRAWIPYLILIFGLSSLPGTPLKPGSLSLDKVLHLVLYGGFGFVILAGDGRWKRLGLSRSLLLGLAVASLVSMLDESWQKLIPGRDSDPADWVADSLGGLAGAWLAFRWGLWRRK